MSGFASINITSQGVGTLGGGEGGTLSQFGETVAVTLTPSAQVTFVQGIGSINFATASMGAGASIIEVSGSAVLRSGTAQTGSAMVQLRRGMKYRAGQGSMGRFTAIFGPPAENSKQLVGLANPESGFYFGRQGNSFGIFHETDGAREIREFTLATPVATTTNVTVTLNDESVTVPIAGGSNNNQTSWEIAKRDYSRLGGGWYAEAYDGKIEFTSLYAGPKTGSFSITAGGSLGSFARVQQGRLTSVDFVSQSQWNVDKMDGTGPSRMTIDLTKGNVFQIGFQYLGFGNTRFSIEDVGKGLFQQCHMIKQANNRTTPVLSDPHVNGTWMVKNEGASVGTFMSGTSGAIFTEGQVLRNIGPAFSFSTTKATSSTAEVPALSIRANRTFSGKSTYGELDVVNLAATVTIGGTGTRRGIVRIYKNLTLTGPVNFARVNAVNSYASADTEATGFVAGSGTLVSTLVLPTDNYSARDLVGDNFYLAVGETLSVTVQSSATGVNSGDFAIALSWFEDQ